MLGGRSPLSVTLATRNSKGSDASGARVGDAIFMARGSPATTCVCTRADACSRPLELLLLLLLLRAS